MVLKNPAYEQNLFFLFPIVIEVVIISISQRVRYSSEFLFIRLQMRKAYIFSQKGVRQKHILITQFVIQIVVSHLPPMDITDIHAFPEYCIDNFFLDVMRSTYLWENIQMPTSYQFTFCLPYSQTAQFSTSPLVDYHINPVIHHIALQLFHVRSTVFLYGMHFLRVNCRRYAVRHRITGFVISINYVNRMPSLDKFICQGHGYSFTTTINRPVAHDV